MRRELPQLCAPPISTGWRPSFAFLEPRFRHPVVSQAGCTEPSPTKFVVWSDRYILSRIRTVDYRCHVTWHSLAKLVHSNLAKPEDRKKEIHEAFGRLWEHFASDFLADLFIAEYNSFKHGFRARAGGFVLKAGIEPSYGVSPPESQMQVVGGSEFGASFFVLERIEGSPVPAKKVDHHFHLTLQNLNWRPESMLQALQSLSMSVNNLVSFLKIVSGRPGKDCRSQQEVMLHPPLNAEEAEAA